MKINYFIFFIIIVLSVLLGRNNTSKNRKLFIILVSILLLLKASLRHLSIGNDTEGYFWEFGQAIDSSWKDVLLLFLNRYHSLSGDYDVGYTLFQKVISMFTTDFHVFTFVAQLLFYIPFGILLYRFCSNFYQLTFAYVLYVSLFMGLPMANARQVYSIGLCIMSFLCLYDKKYIKSVLWIILGYLFHQSALLFFLPFVLSFLPTRIIRNGFWVALVISPLVYAFSNQVVFMMGNMIESDRYAQYGLHDVQGGAYVYLTSSFLMCIFCFFAIKKEDCLDSNKNIHLPYIMLPLTIFFCPLIRSNGSMIRIVMYFQLFFTILFPYAIDCSFKKDDRRIVYIVSMALLIFLSLRSEGYYYFFWQQPNSLF